MRKLARIAYNSSNWHHPTGDAALYEDPSTYNYQNGFGHEDWLFRSEWLIDGWRYAFLQGVNKSANKLIAAKKPLDITLYTIEPPDNKRRFVATLFEAEVLDDEQARDAVATFRDRGWYDVMLEEIAKVEGNASALGAADWATHVLNIRFRQGNVREFPPDTYATASNPALKASRYLLYDLEKIYPSIGKVTTRLGSADPPKVLPFVRKAILQTECTPEHARMQKQLMAELRIEYPQATVLREDDYIDVTVRTPTELILFEIKSDLDPRSVIRQGLGQILEYAYHPTRVHELPLRLVIVGRSPLPTSDEGYLDRLRGEFSLPIEYRVVSI